MRATSTVLDAALFLLFVGAAIATLTLPVAGPPDSDAADATVDVLATSTADVQYTLEPGIVQAVDTVPSQDRQAALELRRSAHGTLADHLATAAVATVAVDGQRVTDTRIDYQRVVTNETQRVTRGRTHLAHVSAVWRPYPDAPLRGTVSVGPTPPPSADVHTERLSVGSGLPDAGEPARRAATNGSFDDVGATVASRIVDGLFPPRTTRSALLGDYPVEPLVAHRYRRFGQALGTNVSKPVSRDDPVAANAKLTRALGDRLAADMRRQFESPDDAARAVSVGTVDVTVRTWSP